MTRLFLHPGNRVRHHLLALFLGIFSLSAFAQSTVTFTPSVTAGDGTLVTNVTWSTNPPLTAGTPCTATSVPNTTQWSGPKAGSGSAPNLTFTADQRLTLACTFPGDSIVTFTWTNPTQNTNGTPYNNPLNVRLKYTFNPTITTNPSTAAAGETHVDVSQTPASTMRTVTGISQTGTMTANAYAQNTNNVFSGPSNAAMKTFTGNVVVTQQVDLIVRSVPNVVTGLSLQ